MTTPLWMIGRKPTLNICGGKSGKMNALTLVRDFLGGDREKDGGSRRMFGRGWTSYLDTLTPRQQEAVLGYRGDDTIGDASVSDRPVASDPKP
jgi:hypothetical protein